MLITCLKTAAFIIAGALAGVGVSIAGEAPEWAVNVEESSLQFEATEQGASFTGEFGVFSADIYLDPEDVSDAHINAEIDISSVEAGSSDRNSALPTREWFFIKDFPVATFASSDISSTGEGTYVASGQLTIRGITRDVSLPFSLEIEGDKAQAIAELALLRTDYKVGPKADWVGHEVKLKITINATRKAAAE